MLGLRLGFIWGSEGGIFDLGLRAPGFRFHSKSWAGSLLVQRFQDLGFRGLLIILNLASRLRA